MISHKHKCIFIHIPRVGGSSIEQAIVGKDWWRIDSSTKHILASTAKKIYKDYWDDYFKFSFVRNPWSRMVSMCKYSSFYGCKIKSNKINILEYLKKFSPIEIDPRSKSVLDKQNPISNSVYLNILNEPLDFVGKFENLQEDFEKISDFIGISESLPHLEPSKNNSNKFCYTKYYDEETREIVAEKYAKDIEYFGYKFGE